MSNEEELARLRAEMDQAGEASKELARALKTFHLELLDQGFDRGEALTLTTGYLTSLLGANSK